MTLPAPGEHSFAQRLYEGFRLISQDDPEPSTYHGVVPQPRTNLPDLQRPSWAKERS